MNKLVTKINFEKNDYRNKFAIKLINIVYAINGNLKSGTHSVISLDLNFLELRGGRVCHRRSEKLRTKLRAVDLERMVFVVKILEIQVTTYSLNTNKEPQLRRRNTCVLHNFYWPLLLLLFKLPRSFPWVWLWHFTNKKIIFYVVLFQ